MEVLNSEVSEKKFVSFPIKMLIFVTCLVFGVVGVMISLLNYELSTKNIENLSEKVMFFIFENAGERVANYFQENEGLLLSSELALQKVEVLRKVTADDFDELLSDALMNFPASSNVAFVAETGNIYRALRMQDQSISTNHILRTKDKVSIYWNHRGSGYNVYLSDQFNSPVIADDLRKTEWYRETLKSEGINLFGPYILPNGKPGVTLSKRSELRDESGKKIVSGALSVNLDFNEISNHLHNMEAVSELSGYAALMNNNFEVLALSDTTLRLTKLMHSETGMSEQILKLNQLDEPLFKNLDLDFESGVDDGRFYHTWVQGILSQFVQDEGWRDFLKDNSESFSYRTFDHDGRSYLFATDSMKLRDRDLFKFGVIIPERLLLSDANLALGFSVGTTALTFFLIMVLGWFLSVAISKPLRRIAAEMNSIKNNFRLDPSVVMYRVRELKDVIEAFEALKQGLSSFKKYVPSEIVTELVKQGKVAKFGGERIELTYFFLDIEGFSEISENHELDIVVSCLKSCFSRFTKVIMENGGTLDKYIGDCIMAFWGAPLSVENQASQACLTAIQCIEELEKINKQFETMNYPQLKVRIGINTGESIVGNIGSDLRLNYTVIGDHVNLASRLEGVNKLYGTTILISEFTYNKASKHIVARKIDRVVVRGRKQELFIYELIAKREVCDRRMIEFTDEYEKALDYYFALNFKNAKDLFEKCRTYKPGDSPTLMLIKRCDRYMDNPPPIGWNGVDRALR